MPISLAFPSIDPVLITIGPFPIRWYALAYIAGLVLGWAYARALVKQKVFWGGAAPLDPLDIDDLLVYAAMGVILGGRLGYVLFYNADFYFAHPAEIFAFWKGGMSFHGGLAGTALAIYALAKRKRISVLSLADVCAAAVPIGLFLGRIANFIKPELWGRPAGVPWAMVFPGAGPSRATQASSMRQASKGLSFSLCFISRFSWARCNGRVSSPGFLPPVMAPRALSANFFANLTRSWAFCSAARPWACSCRCL